MSPSNELPLCPLRFAPLYQYRLWGGRQLAEVLDAPLPMDGPVGEAWVLSDRDDHESRVIDGPFEGRTLHQLMTERSAQLLGARARRFSRFPLLLKFLDVRKMLSVQVHPSDAHAELLPAGETGKTEGWVVLKAGAESRIYAGLTTGTSVDDLRRGLANGRITDSLARFVPSVGDCVFIPAGTVHSLGGDVVVFEIQQNSDVTFRLFDWNHIDEKTHEPRPLQVEEALSCVDLSFGPVGPVTPTIEGTMRTRERLFRCEQFSTWRVRTKTPFEVGAAGVARVVVCLEGAGEVEHERKSHPAKQGDVFLLPAVVGACVFRPTSDVNLLEIALPL